MLELKDMANMLAPFVNRLITDGVSDSVQCIVEWMPDPSPGISPY